MKSIFKNNHKLFIGITATVIALSSLFNSQSAKAQAPGVVGIDHVGLNVPDLNQAITFFHDIFGFDAVTKLGPFPMDATWKKNFHIHDNAGDVTIVMMRAGDGSNIELFEYKPGSGNKEQPYRDDISATHFSLYTSDINSTKSYLESKGLKFLSDVNAGGGDTAGERWVYFETPWGATIELNSYPNGKGYEKNAPHVKLWNTSSAVEFTTETLSASALQNLVGKQIEIWNDLNTKDRVSKMPSIYQNNVAFYDHDGSVQGINALNERITILQKKFSGFKFSLIKIDNTNNVVRYYWNFGPKGNPKLISGMDLMVIEAGKIRSLHVFLDKVPAQPKK